MNSMKRMIRSRSRAKRGERLDLVVVHSADEHGVHFYGTQRRGLRRVDPGDHLIECLRARDALEFLAVERIEADIDAVHARGDEPVAALGQQVAVRGHRKVLNAERFQPRDEILDAGANQRLAARDANFADAHADQNAHQSLVFVPCEQIARRHVLFRVGGAAIDAAEIAAVRDRDAQVGDLAAEFVSEWHDIRA